MFGIDDLAVGALGLGALSSGFGAYSQMQAAQRQRDMYNRYKAQADLMNNPAYQISQAQPYYQQNLNALQQQLPTFMRTTVNPMLGIRGLDPAGGQAQFITQQAIAPQISQAWQNALGTATGQGQNALNALSGATGNIGQPYGQMGGLPNALNSIMFLQAMNRFQNPNQQANPMGDTSGRLPAWNTWQRPPGVAQTGGLGGYTGYPTDEIGGG